MSQKLKWEQHPVKTNVWVAQTEKFHYRKIEVWNGHTTLRIMLSDDLPGAKPKLLKEYRDEQGAKAAARRWERKYGGEDKGEVKGKLEGLIVHLDLDIILNEKELSDYCLAYGLDARDKDSVAEDIKNLLMSRLNQSDSEEEYTWTVEQG